MSEKSANKSDSDKVSDDVSKEEKLDFYSPHFDPLLALKSTGLRPPMPTAKTYDNLAMFNSHLQKLRKDGASSSTSKRKVPKPGTSREQQVEVFQRRFEPHQMPVKSTSIRKPRLNVITRMQAHADTEGIFGVLEKARTQKLLITVQIRHSHGIRGSIIATVTAYDKFWNLTLQNVEEFWIRKRKARTPAIGPPEVNKRLAKYFPTHKVIDTTTTTTMDTIQHHHHPAAASEVHKLAQMLAANEYGRNNKNSELCHRRVNELLVRGEQVVFIAIAQGRPS